MRISVLTLLADSQGTSPVDAYVRDVRAARDQGFSRVWTVQLPREHDVLTTLAVAAREVEGIGLATGVQPVQARHPMVLAQAALTLNLIAGGRSRSASGSPTSSSATACGGSRGTVRSAA